MRTSNVAFGHRERHYVLKLVAEAVGSAGLVKSSASPYTTGERLVEEPAVGKNIHRPVWRRNLYGAEDFVPLAVDLGEDLVEIRGAIAVDQRACVVAVISLTQEDHDLGALAGTQLHHGLERSAWIETRADSSRERNASLQRSRSRGDSVAPKELGSVTRPRILSSTEIQESNSSSKLSTPCAACKQNIRIRIEFRDDMRSAAAARTPQHPFRKRSHGEAARTRRMVLQNQARDLNRVIDRNELEELRQNSLRPIAEPAIALAVPCQIRGSFIASRQHRRAP